MLPSAPGNSISTSLALTATPGMRVVIGVRLGLAALLASSSTMLRERFSQGGVLGYFLLWGLRPLFELSVAGLVYREARPELLRYVVVGLAANTFIFNAIYFVGEILDRERMRGTLVGLFLAPAARVTWLSGFALAGVGETLLAAVMLLVYGWIGFGVRYDPNLPALALTFVLFLASLWGMALVFSAAGLYLKKANALSNVISPFVMLLGGVYYPVGLLPAVLRYPARALPFGYGIQALVDATLYHASIRTLAPQLLPLAAFAVALPIAGVLVFGWLERLVRVRGELDLY